MIPNADDDDNMDTSLNKSLLYVQQPICGWNVHELLPLYVYEEA